MGSAATHRSNVGASLGGDGRDARAVVDGGRPRRRWHVHGPRRRRTCRGRRERDGGAPRPHRRDDGLADRRHAPDRRRPLLRRRCQPRVTSKRRSDNGGPDLTRRSPSISTRSATTFSSRPATPTRAWATRCVIARFGGLRAKLAAFGSDESTVVDRITRVGTEPANAARIVAVNKGAETVDDAASKLELGPNNGVAGGP